MVMAAESVDAESQFQSTEIGEIPADWRLFRLFELSLVTSGKRLPKGAALVQNPTPHPYIRVTDMRMSTVDTSDIRYVPLHLAPGISGYRIFRDDIFISVAGTLGVVGQIPSELDGANLTENADRITNIKCSRRFLMHILQSDLIQSQIDEIRTVGAQPKLALTRLRQFPIPLPPTPEEQEAIAEALSDADALIASLEALIVKKRAIKQGTMQDLLSGSKRLPGFRGEWRETKLGELGTFFKGAGVRRGEAQSGDLPCVRYGEIYTVHNDVVREFQTFISHEVARTAAEVRSGDILFAGSGETKDEIGKSVAIVDCKRAYAGGDIVILRPVECDARYLGYALNHQDIQKQKAARGQGDAVVHVSAKALASIDIRLPALDEQIAIGEVLHQMDTEISLIGQKCSKARQIKKGMMQELLTGRIRLI